jgi:predicted O-methyltransferase YrrM
MRQETTALSAGIEQTEYMEGYFPFLEPAAMAFVAALNGYDAPSTSTSFSYCELGCGKGVTSVAVAAMHPQATVYACDLNEAHVRYAQSLADRSAVSNITLLPYSFADMLSADLPTFDFIVLHGVWSWVPDSARAEIVAFLKTRLRPGGLALVSYNAMPGSAHILPIGRMMRAYAESAPGGVIEKALAALAYVRHLAAGGAAYFAVHPEAARHLDRMAGEDPRYLAHEYMSPHMGASYFADVHAALGGAGLSFAGSMMLEHNFPERWNAAPGLQNLLQTAPTRAVLETHRDFILNARFRRDLYAAQPEAPRGAPPAPERLEPLAFRIVDSPERFQLKRDDGPFRYDLTRAADDVRKLHRLLDRGPAALAEIRAALAPKPAQEVATLLQDLVLLGHLAPCPPAQALPALEALNAALLEDAIREKRSQVLRFGAYSRSANYFELAYAAMIDAIGRQDDPDEAARGVLRRLTQAGLAPRRAVGQNGHEDIPEAQALAILAGIGRGLLDSANADTRRLRLQGAGPRSKE